MGQEKGGEGQDAGRWEGPASINGSHMAAPEAPPWDSESHLQADEGSVSRQRNRQCDGSKTQVHPVSLKNSKQEGQASSSSLLRGDSNI